MTDPGPPSLRGEPSLDQLFVQLTLTGIMLGSKNSSPALGHLCLARETRNGEGKGRKKRWANGKGVCLAHVAAAATIIPLGVAYARLVGLGLATSPSP